MPRTRCAMRTMERTRVTIGEASRVGTHKPKDTHVHTRKDRVSNRVRETPIHYGVAARSAFGSLVVRYCTSANGTKRRGCLKPDSATSKRLVQSVSNRRWLIGADQRPDVDGVIRGTGVTVLRGTFAFGTLNVSGWWGISRVLCQTSCGGMRTLVVCSFTRLVICIMAYIGAALIYIGFDRWRRRGRR